MTPKSWITPSGKIKNSIFHFCLFNLGHWSEIKTRCLHGPVGIVCFNSQVQNNSPTSVRIITRCLHGAISKVLVLQTERRRFDPRLRLNIFAFKCSLKKRKIGWKFEKNCSNSVQHLATWLITRTKKEPVKREFYM
jgi:hypothetical protein